MKCLCPRCNPDAPHPERGTPEFLYSDLHRRECEARHVLKMDKESRYAYYKIVHEKRGEPALRLLIFDVEALYKKVQDAGARTDHAA